MKQITIRVDDKKYASLLEHLKSLDFEVIVEESPSPTETRPESPTEAALTPSQKKLWAGIKEALAEMKLVEEGKLKATSGEEFLEELRREGLLK
ncbi:MAG: hypothetical protein LH606_07035 [Cytophagaceae bacterium]|nr:hypothetical protein [Cytophagaceae bacterium]